ncbi:MAG: BatA and WFA domain-containing protein [Deltaproteobacteria bacterium]|nr:BatA and WFA domain-containing protein [Deltaproteobacteria bacterium]
MQLLAPLQLLWFGLAVPLVLLYVLKRRRTEREVGSTLLWEQALRDLRAERPWKRLMPHLSLLLQLLVLAVGAIALARPVGVGGATAGARTAVVIDTSSSMAAFEGGVTRFDLALGVARSLARALPPGGDLMLIEAAAAPAVVAAPSADATGLEAVLGRLRVRGGRADLEAAIDLAAERLRGAPAGSRIVVLTDSAMDGEIALDGRSAPVEVQRVGTDLPNDAIVAVDVRSRGTDEHPDRADIFVRIHRFAGDPADVFVTASVGDETLASRRISVPANGAESVVLTADLPPGPDGRAPLVRVVLGRPDGVPDAFPLDDVAVVPSPAAGRLPVFLIGAPVPAVERVFRTDPEVELFATTLAALGVGSDGSDGSDGLHGLDGLDGLLVFLGDTPPSPPSGDSVVVAPTGDAVFDLALGEERASPQIITWDENDPLLRFVELSDVHLGALRPIESPAARTLVSTDRGPAVATISRAVGETTLVAFDPAASDWPRDPSFVVFFRNVIERARTRRAAGGIAPGAVGEALRVPVPAGQALEVTTPSGHTLSATARGDLAVVAVPAETGVFEVRAGDRTLVALRNHLDPEESDLRARARFVVGDREAVGARAAVERAESWPWFAGVLILLLLFEMLWATRKGAAT